MCIRDSPYPVLFLQLTDTLTLMNSNPIFGSSLGINYPSWSISSEMISYALFGCCLFMFRKNAAMVLSLFLLGAGLFILYTGRYMYICLLYTSDAADERSSVDLG